MTVFQAMILFLYNKKASYDYKEILLLTKIGNQKKIKNRKGWSGFISTFSLQSKATNSIERRWKPRNIRFRQISNQW